MTAEERLNICAGCEFFNSYLKTCRKCGCYLPVKVKIKFVSCPLNKW